MQKMMGVIVKMCRHASNNHINIFHQKLSTFLIHSLKPWKWNVIFLFLATLYFKWKSLFQSWKIRFSVSFLWMWYRETLSKRNETNVLHNFNLISQLVILLIKLLLGDPITWDFKSFQQKRNSLLKVWGVLSKLNWSL